jgi:hypothetical protein
MLCDKVDIYLVVWRALKPICQVDFEKVEGVIDGGRNAAWVCCIALNCPGPAKKKHIEQDKNTYGGLMEDPIPRHHPSDKPFLSTFRGAHLAHDARSKKTYAIP